MRITLAWLIPMSIWLWFIVPLVSGAVALRMWKNKEYDIEVRCLLRGIFSGVEWRVLQVSSGPQFAANLILNSPFRRELAPEAPQ